MPSRREDKVVPPAASADQERIDAVAVLGRLLHAPRARPHEAHARLALVRRLLSHGGGWWRAEDLSAPSGEDLDELRAGLRELRRLGVLEWDERAQAFALREALRVPLALALLAADADAPGPQQLAALDALVPFAHIAVRGDAAHAPVWAMLDALERDIRTVERALADGPGGLTQIAREGWLLTHAQDMQAAVDRLSDLAATHPGSDHRQLLERAMDLLDQLSARITATSLHMTRTSRDHVRLPGSRRAPSELREIATQLSLEELAETLVGQDLLPAGALALPGEHELAGVYPRDLDGGAPTQERAFPAADNLQAQALVPPAPEPPDPREVAKEAVRDAPPRRLAEHLFAPLPSWEDALRLQQGLVRLQAEAARLGRPGWQAVAKRIELPRPHPVSWLWEIEREVA